MFGIGGAGVSTPAVRLFLDASPAIALGTTLPVTVPTSATGAFTYWRRGFLDRRVAGIACLSGALASAAGAFVTRFVNLHYLMILTGLIILYVAVMTIRRGVTGRRAADLGEGPVIPGAAGEEDEEESECAAPERQAGKAGLETEACRAPALTVLSVGLAAGFLSGLLGIGGGAVLIPGFLYVLKMPIRRAFATSLAVIAVIAIPGTIVHSLLGHVSWSLALYLVIGSIPGSYAGARLNLRTAEHLLYISFGALLCAFGILFIVEEIMSMLA